MADSYNGSQNGSRNRELELLIDQITDAIVARLNGDVGEQAAMCGCTSECFNRCPERMHRIVDAGAARIGLVLGETSSAKDWASLIDHTLLKPEGVEDDFGAVDRCGTFGHDRLPVAGRAVWRGCPFCLMAWVSSGELALL